MKKTTLFPINMLLATALLPCAFAQNLVSPTSQTFLTQERQHGATEGLVSPKSYLAWKISLAPVIASQALDAYSSYGLRELNPVLAGPDHRFGYESALLKLGIAGTLMGVEYLVVRKHPGAAKLLWKLNLASAAVSGATAAHNFSIH